jgi:hypothetical protein
MTQVRKKRRAELRKDSAIKKRFSNSLAKINIYYLEMKDWDDEKLAMEVANKNKSQNYRACAQLIINERSKKDETGQ